MFYSYNHWYEVCLAMKLPSMAAGKVIVNQRLSVSEDHYDDC